MLKPEEFKKPNNSFKGKPFWAWNGELEIEELKKQVCIMKQMGFGGFFMHSRTGLQTGYLSDAWFDCINACADEAEKQGLEAWIYDEDRWPSGSAGGKATQKKENRRKYIKMNVDNFRWSESVIAAFQCELNGINFTNEKMLKKNEAANGTVVWFEIIEQPQQSFYNGNTYLDTMSKSAVTDFINITHEAYKQKCGDRLGKSISGVFTDEPHRGIVMCNYEEEGLNFGSCVPYTDMLFSEFQSRWGYDLREHLPELFLRKNYEPVSVVKWNFMELLQQLFLENYAIPVYEWCKNNNMKLTGHVLHEDNLSAQAIMQGSVMRYYEYMDVPGVDVLTERNYNYCIVKQLSSAARQLGKKWLLSELYGCTGWQLNFESHRNIGVWQALLGINIRCHHLSWYTMKGQAKRDLPASIFYQSAWYKDYPFIEDYFARIGLFMQSGEPVCDVLVINPVESIWCQVHIDWSVWLKADREAFQSIDAHYKKLYNMLLSAHVDFDYADEDMLSRLYKIENGYLYVGKAKYKSVVVSGMLTMRKTTKLILEEFKRNGGEVIILGQGPLYIDALKNENAISARQLPFTKDAVNELRKYNVVDVDSEKIFIQVRKEKNTFHIMLLNTDLENKVSTDIDIRVNGNFTQWDPVEGMVWGIEKPTRITLEAGQEMLIMAGDIQGKPKHTEQLPLIALDEPYSYSLSEPNVCVLDFVKMVVDDDSYEIMDVLAADDALRQRLGLPLRSISMLQPWLIDQEKLKPLAHVKLEYEFLSEIEGGFELAVEDADKIELTVNGEKTVKEPIGTWIDPCFKRIPIQIKKGRNSIIIEFQFKESFNIESIYILGEFGVLISDSETIITEKPDNIGYGDLREFGLPFYGGRITYHFRQKAEKKSVIKFNGLYGAACMYVNHKIIAWSPYEAEVEPCDAIDVELVLTRRNTFGPFRKEASNKDAINEHSSKYDLIKTGLLKQ